MRLAIARNNCMDNKVELVFAPAVGPVVHYFIDFSPGLTVEAAIKASTILQHYPELATLKKGIFSKPVDDHDPVVAGERIEFYRPLLIDPKEKRRLRAKENLKRARRIRAK